VEIPDTVNARAPLVVINNADLSTKQQQQLVKPSPPPPVRPVAEPDRKEDNHLAEQAHDVVMEEEEKNEENHEEEKKQPEPHTTAEGAVADATYHFPSNNYVVMANAVAVDADTTIAFGQWAMGTEKNALKEENDTDAGPVAIDRLTPVIPLSTNNNSEGEEEKEEKKEMSNDGSHQGAIAMQPPLSSIKPPTCSADLRQQQQTPAAGVLFSGFKPTPIGGSSGMQGRRHTFSSVATPGTEFCPAAPAPTPATAFQVHNHNNNNLYIPEGLAEKLNNIAGAAAGGGGGEDEGSSQRIPARTSINNNLAAAAAATPGGSRLGFKSASACKPPVSEARSRSATIQSAEQEQQKQQHANPQPAMMVTNTAAGVEVMQHLSFTLPLPVPHTVGHSRLAMQGTIMDEDDNVDADGKCTAEVVEMEGTAEADGNRDVSPSSLAVVMEEDKGDSEDGGEGETSVEEAAVPELASVVRIVNMSGGNNGTSPLAKAPPPSASHHQNSCRRSSMRTPGTKIVIIERDNSAKMKTGGNAAKGDGNDSCPRQPSLPPHSSNGNMAKNSNNNNNSLSRQFDEATPGSIKPLAMASRLGGLMQSSNNKMALNNGNGSVLKTTSPEHDHDDDEKMGGGDEDEEMEISLAPMAAQVHQEESPLEKMEGEVDQMLATVEKPAQYTVVGTIVQERSNTVEREEKEEREEEQQQQHDMGMISLAQYKSMVLKARAYRTESLQLANALHKMTAKALRLKKSAKALGDALNKETKKRVEVQNVLQQIVEKRFDEEDGDIEEEEEELVEEEEEQEGEMMDVDEEDAHVTPTTTTNVIVVGHVSAPPSSNIIRAGQVVVVRPNMSQPFIAATKTPKSSTKLKAAAAAATGSVVPPVDSNTIAGGSSAGRKRKSSVLFAAASVAPAVVSGGGTATGGKRRSMTIPGSVMVSSNNAFVDDNNNNRNGKRGTTPLKVDNVELPGWLYTEQKEQMPEIARHLQMVAAEEISADGSGDDNDDGDESEEEKKRGMSPEILGSQPLGVESEEDDKDEEDEEDMCHVCGESDEGDVLLLCDDCDNACHLRCCNPPLKRVPKGNWYCAECKAVKDEEKNKGTRRGAGGKKATATQPAAVEKKAVAGKRGASASVVEDEAPKAKRGRGASASTAAPTRSTRSAGRR